MKRMKHGHMSSVLQKLGEQNDQRILNTNAPRKAKTILGLPSLIAIAFMHTCVKTTSGLTSNTLNLSRDM